MYEILDFIDAATGETRLVIHRKGGRGKMVYNLSTRELRDLDIGETIPEEFIIKLPWSETPDILRAFSTWLHQKGIRPDAESITQGKLQATLYHLEDLRHLLKLDDRNKPDLAAAKPDHATEAS